jgi:hypothetical protein
MLKLPDDTVEISVAATGGRIVIDNGQQGMLSDNVVERCDFCCRGKSDAY